MVLSLHHRLPDSHTSPRSRNTTSISSDTGVVPHPSFPFSRITITTYRFRARIRRRVIPLTDGGSDHPNFFLLLPPSVVLPLSSTGSPMSTYYWRHRTVQVGAIKIISSSRASPPSLSTTSLLCLMSLASETPFTHLFFFSSRLPGIYRADLNISHLPPAEFSFFDFFLLSFVSRGPHYLSFRFLPILLPLCCIG